MAFGAQRVEPFEMQVRTAARELRHPAMHAVWSGALLLMIGGFVRQSPALWMGAAGWFFVFMAFFYFWRPLRILAIDDERLRLNRKPMMARGEIASAVAYEDAHGRCHVAIASGPRTWGGGLLDFDLPDMTAARAIVRALDLPACDFYRTRILDHSTLTWLFGLTTAAGLSIVFETHGSLLWLWGFLWAFLTVVLTIANRRTFIGTEYVVGSDGLRIRRFFRVRFIPFSELEKIDRGAGLDRFCVRLHIGRKKPLLIDGMQVHRIAQVHMKISEALERYRLHAVAGQTPSDLERRDRSTNEWLVSLRSLGSSSTTKYRVAATSPDDLARVLSDHSAGSSARAASAIALDAIDPKAALRIRDVAEHTANPKLRVALEQIADHAADAEIEASLDELSEAKSR